MDEEHRCTCLGVEAKAALYTALRRQIWTRDFEEALRGVDPHVWQIVTAVLVQMKPPGEAALEADARAMDALMHWWETRGRTDMDAAGRMLVRMYVNQLLLYPQKNFRRALDLLLVQEREKREADETAAKLEALALQAAEEIPVMPEAALQPASGT